MASRLWIRATRPARFQAGPTDRRTADETEHLLAPAVFVEEYEEEHRSILLVSAVDMLRYLVETHQKTQRDIAVGTGLSDSTISEILAGNRRLMAKQVEALARFFIARKLRHK
jgi:HTH-type transcriptional regulator/antitoxin HigA